MNSKHQEITVYCDSDYVYEALSGAVFEAMARLFDSGESFGAARNHLKYDEQGKLMLEQVRYAVTEEDEYQRREFDV